MFREGSQSLRIFFRRSFKPELYARRNTGLDPRLETRVELDPLPHWTLTTISDERSAQLRPPLCYNPETER